MSRTLLRQAGETLWGPQYRSEMARQLGVHLRTVMRWQEGRNPVPAVILARLGKLLRQRQSEIVRLVGKFPEEE